MEVLCLLRCGWKIIARPRNARSQVFGVTDVPSRALNLNGFFEPGR